MCTLWHCNSMFGRTYSAKVCAHKIPKFIKILFCLTNLRKIGICFGNWPIADFFHDQTIFKGLWTLHNRSFPEPEWVKKNVQCKHIVKNSFAFNWPWWYSFLHFKDNLQFQRNFVNVLLHPIYIFFIKCWSIYW